MLKNIKKDILIAITQLKISLGIRPFPVHWADRFGVA